MPRFAWIALAPIVPLACASPTPLAPRRSVVAIQAPARNVRATERWSLGQPPPRAGRCTLAAPHGPLPLGADRQGGSVVLARWNSGTIAYVADEDRHAILTVSVDERKALATTQLEGTPAQVLV